MKMSEHYFEIFQLVKHNYIATNLKFFESSTQLFRIWHNRDDFNLHWRIQINTNRWIIFEWIYECLSTNNLAIHCILGLTGDKIIIGI